MPDWVQPSLTFRVLAPPAVNAASAVMLYGAFPLVGSVTENVTTGKLPGAVGGEVTRLVGETGRQEQGRGEARRPHRLRTSWSNSRPSASMVWSDSVSPSTSM